MRVEVSHPRSPLRVAAPPLIAKRYIDEDIGLWASKELVAKHGRGCGPADVSCCPKITPAPSWPGGPPAGQSWPAGGPGMTGPCGAAQRPRRRHDAESRGGVGLAARSCRRCDVVMRGRGGVSTAHQRELRRRGAGAASPAGVLRPTRARWRFAAATRDRRASCMRSSPAATSSTGSCSRPVGVAASSCGCRLCARAAGSVRHAWAAAWAGAPRCSSFGCFHDAATGSGCCRSPGR